MTLPTVRPPPAIRLSLQLDLNAPLLLLATALDDASLSAPLVRIGCLHFRLAPPAVEARPAWSISLHLEVSLHLAPQQSLLPLLSPRTASSHPPRSPSPTSRPISPPARPTATTDTRMGGGAGGSAALRAQGDIGDLEVESDDDSEAYGFVGGGPARLSSPSVLAGDGRTLGGARGGRQVRRPMSSSLSAAAGWVGGAAGGAGGASQATSRLFAPASAASPTLSSPQEQRPRFGISSPTRLIGEALERFNAEAARTLELAARLVSMDEASRARHAAAEPSHGALLGVSSHVIERLELPLLLRVGSALPGGAGQNGAVRIASQGALPQARCLACFFQPRPPYSMRPRLPD